MIPATDRRVQITCWAKEFCHRCGGTGFLRQVLEGKSWSEIGPVACDCLMPQANYRDAEVVE